MNGRWLHVLPKGAVLSAPLLYGFAAQAQAGLFTAHADVGKMLHPGDTQFDAVKGTYTVAGSGENLWSTHDDVQYVWTKVSGDVALSADISFVGKKAMLIARLR